jgi:hypothetical protein
MSRPVAIPPPFMSYIPSSNTIPPMSYTIPPILPVEYSAEIKKTTELAERWLQGTPKMRPKDLIVKPGVVSHVGPDQGSAKFLIAGAIIGLVGLLILAFLAFSSLNHHTSVTATPERNERYLRVGDTVISGGQTGRVTGIRGSAVVEFP